MLLQVVVIRDRAADVYGVPAFTSSVGIAIRSFSDEVNRAAPDNQLNKHAEDFDLFLIGTYDDQTGTFATHAPRQIAIGKDVFRQ